MKQPFILLVMFCVVVAVSATAQPVKPDALTALQTEVRQLRRELVQQRIEFQQWKIEQLETALRAAKDERNTLESEERAVHQALTEPGSAEGDEATNFRAELTENTLRKLQTRQAAAQQRETELQEKLTREQTILQSLEKRLRQVKTED
ncbi:MAG TPA: hypothetical protein VFZ34_12760 [Blastocatellia bacterium]|nr:hypothetical protein [Blastocatellia bacterium]